MARLRHLSVFEEDLARRLHLESDYALSEAFRAALQLCDVVGYIVDALFEKDEWLERRFKTAAKAVQRGGGAEAILDSANSILQSGDPGLPDLLAAWSGVLPDAGHLRQLWFATEAFTLACYRQAIAQQLQLLTRGILFTPEDPGEWQRLERDASALVSAAGAAAMVAQRARNHRHMEEQVGSALCGNLERLAGLAAALHVLLAEWKPAAHEFAEAEDMLTRLERLFQRSQLWIDQAVRLLEMPVEYKTPARKKS